MRIFSKFKDYYDCALNVFNDPSIVYDRQTRIETVVRNQEIPHRICTGRNEWFAVFNSCTTLFHIGLCGKWFHSYRYQRSKDPFDAEFHYVKQEEIQEKLPWFSKGDPIVDMGSDPFWKHDIFVQFNSPILAVGYNGSKYSPHSKNYDYTVIVNPKLTSIPISQMIQCGLDYKLQNIEEDIRLVTQLDPYTAMQELEMFIGNVLTNNTTPTMPVGTDDQIRDSKGFDKWSFRKMKEKK